MSYNGISSHTESCDLWESCEEITVVRVETWFNKQSHPVIGMMSFDGRDDLSSSDEELVLFWCPICLTVVSDMEKHWMENKQCVDSLMPKKSHDDDNSLSIDSGSIVLDLINRFSQESQTTTEETSRPIHVCKHCGKEFVSASQLLEHYHTFCSCFTSQVNTSRMQGPLSFIHLPTNQQDDNGNAKAKRKPLQIASQQMQKKIALSNEESNKNVNVTLKAIVEEIIKEGLPHHGPDMRFAAGEAFGGQ